MAFLSGLTGLLGTSGQIDGTIGGLIQAIIEGAAAFLTALLGFFG